MAQTEHGTKGYLFAHVVVKHKLFSLSQLECYTAYLNSPMNFIAFLVGTAVAFIYLTK